MRCEWQLVKISDICIIRYGKDHKNLSDGQFPVYGSGGVMRYADKSLYNKKSVLIPRKGTLSNLFFVNEPFWTVDTLFYTEINESVIIPEFLYFYLRTLNLASMNVGTAVPSLTTAVLNELEFSLPPLTEQKRIVAILSALDDKIELNNRMNKNLEAQAQAIFKSWFVNFEPWGGVMPVDWNAGTLGEYCKVKSGFAFKSQWWTDSGIKVIKIKNIGDNLDLNDCSFVAKDKIDKAKDFIVVAGDLLIAMTGATIGKFSIIPYANENFLVNQRVGKFFLGEKPIEKLPFLYCSLKTDSVISDIINKGQGSAQPNISPSDIESVEILLPTIDIIEKFNTLLLSFFEKMLRNANQSQTLAALRDTLLPKLMSGEISVLGED